MPRRSFLSMLAAVASRVRRPLFHLSTGRLVACASIVLLGLAAASAVYKTTVLGYELDDVLPRTKYTLSYRVSLDGRDLPATVRTFIPVSDERQDVVDEVNDSPGMLFSTSTEGLNKTAAWSSPEAPRRAEITYRVDLLTYAVHYDIEPSLEIPARYPDALAPYLRAEDNMQVDDEEITKTVSAIEADRGSLLAVLRRIFDFTSQLGNRPYKGATDALTALRLGEASCNGKSRLFVALSRAAGIPARLVGGLILERGSKRTSHQWAEVFVRGNWVPMCPTNRHFAGLPASYLVLYRGDEGLFSHTKDINFQYRFETSTSLVPSPKAKQSLAPINVWALFERLDLPFSLLRTLLMLPIGALVVVLFRNVVGVPTFGTFLPALIAAAAAETGFFWGIVGMLIVVAVVASARLLMQRLELLHSPTLAILLAGVAATMLATSLVAERLGVVALTRITLFPIAVLAITAERFYLSLSEHGAADGVKELLGTIVVILACYAVMSSLALQVLVIGYPETIVVVLALNLLLGRWTGVRLSEYIRFRKLLLSGSPR